MNVSIKPDSTSVTKYFPFAISVIESLPRNTKKKASSTDMPSRSQKSRYGEKDASMSVGTKNPF